VEEIPNRPSFDGVWVMKEPAFLKALISGSCSRVTHAPQGLPVRRMQVVAVLLCSHMSLADQLL
jgi:hypothetical protein